MTDWPQDRETVHDHYAEKPFVKGVGHTRIGLLLDIDGGVQRHGSLGRLLTSRGWAVDYIDWEDRDMHITPVPTEGPDA